MNGPTVEDNDDCMLGGLKKRDDADSIVGGTKTKEERRKKEVEGSFVESKSLKGSSSSHALYAALFCLSSPAFPKWVKGKGADLPSYKGRPIVGHRPTHRAVAVPH